MPNREKEIVKDNTGTAPSVDTAVALAAGREFGKFRENLTEGSMSAIGLPGIDEAVRGDEEDRKLLAQTSVISVLGGEKLKVSKAELLKLRLAVLSDLLNRSEDVPGLRKVAEQKKKIADQTLRENMRLIFREQRPFEKSLIELDSFYKIARQGPEDKNLPVQIANVTTDEIRQNDKLFTELSQQIPKESAFTLERSVGLIVLPGWLRSEEYMKKFGEMARDAKGMVFTDLKDCETYEEAAELFGEGGDLASLKGREDWKGQMSMVGNPLLVRQRNRYEDDDLDDLYISPSAILAAKVFHGDDSESLSRAQAGADCKILLETMGDVSVRPRWNLTDRKEHLKFNDCVIPVVWQGDGKWVFWGCHTLSSEEYSKQYPVRRVQEFIEKCVLNYLNGRTWTENTQTNRQQFYDTLSSFLIANSGEGKMLAGGKVVHVEVARDEAGQVLPEAVDIKLDLHFKFTTERFTVTVRQRVENLQAHSKGSNIKTTGA